MSTYEAVKVRLDPTPRQARLLASHAGAARFAYNAGLAHVKDMLENGETFPVRVVGPCAQIMDHP